MNTIPRSFWHAASFSLITFTIGFLFISYLAGSIKLKYKDLELSTQRAIEFSDTVKDKSVLVAQRERKISELEALLEGRTNELKRVSSNLTKLRSNASVQEYKNAAEKIQRFVGDQKFTSKLTLNKQSLSDMKSIQKAVDTSLDFKAREFVNIQPSP